MSGKRGTKRSSFAPRRGLLPSGLEIADDHQGALIKLHINSTRRVRQYQRVDTQQLESLMGKVTCSKRVAFVK